MVKFDRYILNELSGEKRLLFENHNDCIYVWLDEEYFLTAFQIVKGDNVVSYNKRINLKVGKITNWPFNRAVHIINLNKNSIVEIKKEIGKFLNCEFKSMFNRLKQFDVLKEIKLLDSEIEIVKKTSQSKMYK